MIGKIVDKRYLTRGFGALQMLYWCTCGSSSTYIVSYMTDVRGASASLSGMLLAVYMLCGCIGLFLINGICDRMQNNRRVFITGMLLSLAFWYGVYLAPGIPMVFLCYGLMGLMLPAMAAVLDTWLIRSFPDDPGAYSPIRSLASLAYSCLMLVMGFAISSVGHVVMLILPTLFAVCAAVMARYMPEIPALDRTPSEAALPTARLSSLHPVVWMMIVSIAIMGVANMPLLNMNLLIMESVGGTVTHSGVAIFFNTAAEFLTMRYLCRWLNRMSARAQLVLSAFLYVTSVVMMLAAGNIPLLYLALFINGVAYGIQLPARRRFIGENVPDTLLNRMNAVTDIAFNNFGGLVGNQMSGMVIDRLGVSFMLSICVVLKSISFAMSLTFRRLQNLKKGD